MAQIIRIPKSSDADIKDSSLARMEFLSPNDASYLTYKYAAEGPCTPVAGGIINVVNVTGQGYFYEAHHSSTMSTNTPAGTIAKTHLEVIIDGITIFKRWNQFERGVSPYNNLYTRVFSVPYILGISNSDSYPKSVLTGYRPSSSSTYTVDTHYGKAHVASASDTYECVALFMPAPVKFDTSLIVKMEAYFSGANYTSCNRDVVYRLL